MQRDEVCNARVNVCVCMCVCNGGLVQRDEVIPTLVR